MSSPASSHLVISGGSEAQRLVIRQGLRMEAKARARNPDSQVSLGFHSDVLWGQLGSSLGSLVFAGS